MKYWGNTLDYRHIFIITGLLQISHVAASLLLISLHGSDIAWLYVRWTMGVITTHNIEVHWLVSASVKILIIFTHTCIIENK